MTKLTRRVFLNTILVTTVGCAAVYQCSCTPNAPTGAVEVTGPAGHSELTTGVISPGKGACTAGRVYIAAQWQSLLKRNLINPGNGPFDATFPTVGPSQNLTAHDNHFARLANGDLLLLWLAGNTAPLSPAALAAQEGANLLPSWWNNFNAVGSPTTGRNGYRPALLLWRFSADECKWSSTPMILDAGEIAASSGSGSSVGYCAQLAPKFGGFDRPELYVDPWGVNPNDSSKQRIYASTSCARCLAPPCDLPDGKDDDNVQLFTSLDSGASWDIGRRFPPAVPLAMTSTAPNGRLFMFNLSAGATIFWADPNPKGLLGGVKGPFDVTFVDNNGEFIKGATASQPVQLAAEALLTEDLGFAVPGAAPIALARGGKNSTLAVYPAVEFAAGSVKPVKRQVAVVVWVVATAEPPWVIPIKIIRAKEETGSVLLASFIEDDRPDAPSATSLLYWLETKSKPQPGEKFGMLARYMLFTNGITPGKEELLSDPAGWQVRFTADPEKLAWFGDYMKGAFYFHDGALNFVPVWPQVAQVGSPAEPENLNTQAYMRIITVQPPPPAPPPNPEGMRGTRKAGRPTASPGGKP